MRQQPVYLVKGFVVSPEGWVSESNCTTVTVMTDRKSNHKSKFVAPCRCVDTHICRSQIRRNSVPESSQTLFGVHSPCKTVTRQASHDVCHDLDLCKRICVYTNTNKATRSNVKVVTDYSLGMLYGHLEASSADQLKPTCIKNNSRRESCISGHCNSHREMLSTCRRSKKLSR